MKITKLDDSILDNIRKEIYKLISEEYFAYQLYIFSKLAVNSEYINSISQLFDKIAIDEFNDHMLNLVKWCRDQQFDVPCSEKDFKSFANPETYKIIQNLKKNEDALYYVDEAIKSEELAIESYKKAIETKDLYKYSEL